MLRLLKGRDAHVSMWPFINKAHLRSAALAEIVLELARSHDSRAVLEKAAHAARRIIGAQYAGVAILEDDGKRLRHFIPSGVDPALTKVLAPPDPARSPFREILAGRKAVRRAESGTPLALMPQHPPVRSFAAAPLETPARLYGWLHIAEKLGDSVFTEGDEQILTALAAQVAVAYENAERCERLLEEAAKLRAELEACRQAQSRFQSLLETAPAGIVITDERGQITDVNQLTERMFGYRRDELLAQSLEALIPERFRDGHKRHRAEYTQNPRLRPMGIGMQLAACRKDGSEFPVEISLSPLVAGKETMVSCLIVDLTERKKLEGQLRASQRLEAVGMLAGSVAHDFNNLVGVILGASDLLCDTLAENDPARNKIEEVRKAALSAADLTRQLLAFAGRQTLEPKVLDVGGIVQGITPMLRRLIGEHIQLSVAIAAGLGLVRADRGQVEQVILNLAINARDAMPHGGRLAIELRDVELDSSSIDRHPPVTPGPYVRLAVADTGCGMDAATLSRVFEPFFTTKAAGVGTGMGLPTVYSIVLQSAGQVSVDSEVGKGTVVKVYLPRVEGSAHLAETNRSAEAIGGCETILLVEDAVPLREMTREYLTKLGYTVLEAENGIDALHCAAEFPGPIHLLLTDVVMPEMSGRELAEEFTRRYPEAKVLYVSGYTADPMIQKGLLERAGAFLQKPYAPRALAKKLREVFGCAPAPSARRCG